MQKPSFLRFRFIVAFSNSLVVALGGQLKEAETGVQQFVPHLLFTSNWAISFRSQLPEITALGPRVALSKGCRDNKSPRPLRNQTATKTFDSYGLSCNSGGKKEKK